MTMPQITGSYRSSSSGYAGDDSRYRLPDVAPVEPAPTQWDYKTSPVNMEGEALPPNALGWRPDGSADFGPGLEGWWKKAYYNVTSAKGRGWNTGTEIAERNRYQSDILPRFAASFEIMKATAGEMLWGGLGLLGSLAIGLERAAGVIGMVGRDVSQGRPVGEGDYWKNTWEASRLTYNVLVDGFKGKGDEIRQEFADRMMEGERPDLIAEDMLINGKANPWIEMGGQLIFDPFNVDLFANFFGKSRKALSLGATMKKTFATVENDALREIVEAAAQGGGRVTAAEHFDDALRIHQQTVSGAVKMVEKLRKPGAISFSGLPARAKQVANLISDSRNLFFSNRAGAVIDDIVRRTGADPGEILDVFDAMVKAGTSSNAADAAEGFRHLLEYKNPAVLLSEAGNELAAILGRMIEKHGATWFGDIAKAGSTERVAELLMKNLNGALDELFPSAIDMVKAMDKARDAARTGEKLDAATARTAELGKRMSLVERTVAKMHASAQAGIVGKLNRAFSTIYMNWAPGYAFRNGVQNNLQVFLDYGPAAYVKGADALIAEANKFHGTHLVAAGYEPANVAVGAAKTTAPAKTGFLDVLREMFWSEGKPGIHARAASEVLETNAARRVVGSQYIKTFRQALEPMVKDLAKKPEFRGVPPDVWEHIQSAVYNNFGDVRMAMDEVRSAVQNQSINIFQDYGKIPKGLRDFLFQAGKADEVVRDVLRAPTKEAALTGVDGIFDTLENASAGAYLDGMPATPGDPLSDLLQMAHEEGYTSSARGLLIEAQRQVSNETIAKASDIIADVRTYVQQRLGVVIPKSFDEGIRPLMQWGDKTSDQVKAVRHALIAAKETLTDSNIPTKWAALQRALPSIGDAPATKKEAISQIWQALEDFSDETWRASRDATLESVVGWMSRIEQELGVALPPQYGEALDDVLEYAAQWRNVSVGEMGLIVPSAAPLEGTRASQIAQLAEQYGISSASYAGVPRDKYILNIINKYSGVEFRSLDDPIDLATANRAFAKKTGQAEAVVEGGLPEALLPPYRDGAMPTYARALIESDLATARAATRTYVENNFGRLKTVAADFRVEELLAGLVPEIEKRVQTIRTVSARVAEEARNFTLLNYGEKSYWDVASAYVMPYGFWYKGTYKNWMQRIVNNPAIFAGYSKYKEAMQLTHSGLPDWWKQNIEINSILGIDLEHPLYFNLEATLNPLNGITGVDFNDPEKATNWFTYGLNELGKFGPTTWTPFSIATGLILRARGQENAGNAWIGRMIPQTALVKTWTGKELDPAVAFLMNGYDKYERRRIGRALSEMVLQEQITQEQAIEVDRLQSGPIWEQAAQLANEYRRAGQTMSTLFGAGFKARSKEDMLIDQFDGEYRRLMTLRSNMSAEDFKNQLANLGEKYPFMDTVLISRKTGPDRDLAYAYNILGRLQPGDMSDVLSQVGVLPSVVNRFYEDKGDMSGWTEGDRMRFMAAMIDLGAITKMPDKTTRQEWNATRAQYAAMKEAVASRFGSQIYAMIDDYYAALDHGEGDAFLSQFPRVRQALDAENAFKANNRLLATYYGGIEVIQKYYDGAMRAELRQKYGEDIYEVYYAYLDEVDPKIKSKIYKANPSLKLFIRDRSRSQNEVNRQIAALGSRLPDEPNTPIRDGSSETQNLLGETLNASPISAPQLLAEMTPSMAALVEGYFNGEDLPFVARDQLDFIGDRYGLTANEVLQILGAGQ